MDTESATAALPHSPAQPMGLGARLVNIFINPAAVFESIRIKPAWASVVLILSLFSAASTFVVMQRIGPENVALQQMKNSPMLAEQSDSELQEKASQQAKFTLWIVLVSALVGLWIIIPAIAGLLYLLAVMFGSDVPYKSYLALTAHTFWMYSLATSIVTWCVVFLTSDPSTIDIQNAVQANLGVLVSRQEHPALHSLASSMDLFSFWHLAIIGLGILILTNRRWGFAKSVMIPVTLWLIYVGIKVAFVFAFSK
ncbi:MAG TPA: YIP1 family protein [Acidobacteriota bacterium]|jgi:hypothetical protein